MSGTIYLIPCPISESGINMIPPATIEATHKIKHFIVERSKTARAYLKLIKHPIILQEIQMLEIDKHLDHQPELIDFLQMAKKGIDIGIISEAGCPAVADPGSDMVRWAHSNQIRVVPLSGPSSILMAIMSSGMNGQGFTFRGYLSAKKDKLKKQLVEIEQIAMKSGLTQIFMETPYRNNHVFEVAIKTLSKNTLFGVASSIGSENEFICTKSIAQWKSSPPPDLHKKPTIFMLL